MAELIPLYYRLRVATRRRLEHWIMLTVPVIVMAGIALGLSFAWHQQATRDVKNLRNEFQARSDLIRRSEELKEKREHLAERMATIQQLMDDKILLALLHSIADGFGTNDSLEYIHIDARNISAAGKNDEPGGYVVHLNGITTNSTTLAELMTRLGKNTRPGVTVLLDSSKREAYLDGQVMRFQITCERSPRAPQS